MVSRELTSRRVADHMGHALDDDRLRNVKVRVGLARGEVDSPQDVLPAGGVTCTRPVTSSGK